MRRILLSTLKILVSAALLYFSLRKVNLADLVARIDVSSLGWIGVAIAVTFLQIFIGVLRWREISAECGAPLPTRQAMRFNVIGTFFNQTLPSSIGGDAVRLWLVARSGAGWRAATYSIFVDRAIGPERQHWRHEQPMQGRGCHNYQSSYCLSAALAGVDAIALYINNTENPLVLAKDTKIELKSVGDPDRPNVGILRVSAPGRAEQGRELRVEVEIGNYSAAARDIQVELDLTFGHPAAIVQERIIRLDSGRVASDERLAEFVDCLDRCRLG